MFDINHIFIYARVSKVYRQEDRKQAGDRKLIKIVNKQQQDTDSVVSTIPTHKLQGDISI